MDGRVIYQNEAIINNGTINKQINLSAEAPAGTYFIRVKSPGEERVLKFVKN
jgi:hypothetical protein